MIEAGGSGHVNRYYRTESPYPLDVEPPSDNLQGLIQDLAQLPKGSIVLDLGAGGGRLPKLCSAVQDRGFQVLGVEYDRPTAEKFNVWAREHGQPDRIIATDARQIYFTSGGIKKLLSSYLPKFFNRPPNLLQVDRAVSWRVLHNFEWDQVVEVSRNVRDALPPGGIFDVAVLSDKDWKLDALKKLNDPNFPAITGELIRTEPVMNFIENRGRAREDPKKKWSLLFFTPDDIRKLAADAGFELVSISPVFEEGSALDELRNHPNNPKPGEHEDYDKGIYDRSKVKYYQARFRKPE